MAETVTAVPKMRIHCPFSKVHEMLIAVLVWACVMVKPTAGEMLALKLASPL